MLKKLFIASLLLVLTITANATPIKTGISGEFDIFATADITLNAAGEVTLVNFLSANVALTQPGDNFASYLSGGQALILDASPVDISTIIGLQLWNINGFEFTATEVRLNQTAGLYTNLSIIGEVAHDDFLTTSTEFLLSFQNLTVDGSKRSAFSGTITSPAPAVVPEPGTLAMLSLGLIGFTASRKKKPV